MIREKKFSLQFESNNGDVTIKKTVCENKLRPLLTEFLFNKFNKGKHYVIYYLSSSQQLISPILITKDMLSLENFFLRNVKISESYTVVITESPDLSGAVNSFNHLSF